jgi:phage terminase small subunit
MAKKKLTHLQERFKNNILNGMDAKNAYIKAGYKARGAAAESAASRLLRNVKVAAVIEKAQKDAAYNAEITAKRILKEEACIAFQKVGTIFELRNGTPIRPNELPEDVQRAVAGVEIIKTGAGEFKTTRYKYKFWDKGRSLERISRHLGMYNDKLNLGFSSETLNAILSGLPDEYARAVRTALGELVSGK